ncbi:hypothetical protein SPBR_03824 [Sporothrix brasiliensis 5110]|uniref:Uncharacterized protein n=1 Tax=Sporothrix brasiliensis 5110 TaxID=1398154 RepID=A0A0C2JD89_9PEZI|nr:uncharacterized protein SPBR_03824 [Sporothrix brasiliensis 5110]KIH94912.1 hypothetical protein SPBR_03824 [Sporothrix brasiliensis 5110]
MGDALPDDILSQFTSTIASNNVDAVHGLLNEHFSDRSKAFPGKYHVHELYPCLSQAARHNQVEILNEILVPYTHLCHAFDFVAREGADSYSKNTLLLLLHHGWDINHRRDSDTTVLESFLCDSTPDRDSQERRDMAYWLIDHGAALNDRPTNTDMTGMSYAVLRAPVDFVRELLYHHGGDAKRGQLLHNTLLRRPRDDIVEMLGLLLDRGAPLNLTLYASDERLARLYRIMDLGTPLHEAAQMGNAEAVKYLLAQGADTSILSTRNQMTAQEWAVKAGHDEIAAILQSSDQFKI